MNIYDVLTEKEMFSFMIDESFLVTGLSAGINELGYDFIGKTIFDMIDFIFDNADFSNKKFCKNATEIIKKHRKTGVSKIYNYTLTNDLDNEKLSLQLNFGIDVFDAKNNVMIIKFASFVKINSWDDFYEAIIEDYKDEFTGMNDLLNIGKFLIDCSHSTHEVYANSIFPKLMNIPKSSSNMYQVSKKVQDRDSNVLYLEPLIYNGIGRLIKGETKYFNDEMEINGNTLQIEAKVLKEDATGNPLYVAGLVFNVSAYRDSKNIQIMNQIYELAIESGNIGIFHYDFDRYGKNYFIANDIYRKLTGITANEQGFCRLQDFEKIIVSIEDEVTGKNDVRETLDNLMGGKLSGTTDHLLKIINARTKEEIYLLSSSKVQSRYEDQTPKEFGGFVIDVTERIESEKNKVYFAYTDDLTKLPNKRKLLKDMRDKTSGIGVYLDLDNFKKVNDNFGHATGDKVLFILGESLLEVSKNYLNLYPYRLHGDEFFVFIDSNDISIIDSFNKDLKQHYDVSLIKLGVDLEYSYGYSIYKDTSDIDEFIKEADYEMYRDKIHKRETIKDIN